MDTLSFDQWQQNLLSSDADLVRAALACCTDYTSNKQTPISLALPAWMHPDEEIRRHAQHLLLLFANGEPFQALKNGFQIFASILEFFPWMGDYKNLQKNNFEQFLPIRSVYLPLIAKFDFYTDIYLDTGRKLYVLFELEDAAQTCFEDILVYNDSNAEAFYSLGRIFEKRTHYSRAVAHYERCIALQPQHLYGLLQLGWIKTKILGKHNEAIYHYNKIIEIEPYMVEVNVRLAEAYYALGEFDRCRQFVDIALAINEFHEEALHLLATIQWKQENDFEKAEQTLQKGLDHIVHGDSGLLLASLAEMQVEYLQEYDKGRTFYEKSLQAQPNQPDVVRRFAKLLLSHFQSPDAARQVYETFLQYQPRNAAVRVEYAEMLVQYFQDMEFAAEQLRIALHWDETSKTAQQLLSQIEATLLQPPPTDENIQPEDTNDGYDDDDDDDDDDNYDDDGEWIEGGAAGDN